MMALESNLAGVEMDYATLSDTLERHEFTLGGNWDYQQGCFDRRLDGEKQTVWLRIPFHIPKGVFDPETAKQVTRVKIGTPFVLRHLYNIGEDDNPRFNTAGALVNQFQTPENVDAPVEQSYLDKAAMIVKEVEEAFAAIKK
ncbi:YugN family protein [Paenibacillus alkalitolerans]|uniref:YugN family protein n=1 Tax=Paenibacillus alkalitolerans TaxID=2799335 RepID=UPI0018F2E075|nr:YugN family protein [Paenibacillus alkalitolerans]